MYIWKKYALLQQKSFEELKIHTYMMDGSVPTSAINT